MTELSQVKMVPHSTTPKCPIDATQADRAASDEVGEDISAEGSSTNSTPSVSPRRDLGEAQDWMLTLLTQLSKLNAFLPKMSKHTHTAIEANCALFEDIKTSSPSWKTPDVVDFSNSMVLLAYPLGERLEKSSD